MGLGTAIIDGFHFLLSPLKFAQRGYDSSSEADTANKEKSKAGDSADY